MREVTEGYDQLTAPGISYHLYQMYQCRQPLENLPTVIQYYVIQSNGLRKLNHENRPFQIRTGLTGRSRNPDFHDLTSVTLYASSYVIQYDGLQWIARGYQELALLALLAPSPCGLGRAVGKVGQEWRP